MSYTNFVVSSLPDYVQTNKDVILKDVVLGGDFIKRIGIQSGIKKDAYLNFLDMAPAFGDGSSCGFTAAGTATLTQRTINTANLNVQMEICPRNLVGKYAEYLVRNNATEHSLPFEQYIMEGVQAEVKNNLEILLWQGDPTNQSTDPVKKWTKGVMAIATSDLASANKLSIASGTSAYDGILAVYMALPEVVLRKGAEIYVSPAIYRQFMQEMVERNYFHYAPGVAESGEFILPGTDCKVVKVYGLTGSLSIFGTFAQNLVYGCDLESDSEVIDLWFSQDNRTFRLEILWNSGIQIAVPDWAIMGTFAATPVSPNSLAKSIGAIATSTATIATNSGSLASAVNSDHQIETHPNS